MWLVLVLLLVGMLWCFCCGCPCVRCAGGTGPSQVQVVLSGWANGICTDCTSLNTTFVLDCPAPSPLNPDSCWQYVFSPAVCPTGDNYVSLEVRVQLSGATYFVNVELYDGTSGLVRMWWRYNAGASAPDCSAWSALPIPLLSNGSGHCNGAVATCSLTSL